MGILENIKAWSKEKYVPTYRGKPMTKGESFAQDFAALWFFAMMSFILGVVFSMHSVFPTYETSNICHSLIPDGFHFVSFDASGKKCIYSDGENVVHVGYLFDYREARYILDRSEG